MTKTCNYCQRKIDEKKGFIKVIATIPELKSTQYFCNGAHMLYYWGAD